MGMLRVNVARIPVVEISTRYAQFRHQSLHQNRRPDQHTHLRPYPLGYQAQSPALPNNRPCTRRNRHQRPRRQRPQPFRSFPPLRNRPSAQVYSQLRLQRIAAWARSSTGTPVSARLAKLVDTPATLLGRANLAKLVYTSHRLAALYVNAVLLVSCPLRTGYTALRAHRANAPCRE